MREYKILPEFPHSKAFPFGAIACQAAAIGLGIVGAFVTSMGFILAICFQFCAVYYVGLFLCNRYYYLNVTSEIVTVWNIFGISKKHQRETLRWKIRKIPWFNNYFILLYSSGRVPVAIIKPLWKNALKTLRFPHFGKMTEGERNYLHFLKSAGLLGQDIKGRFYALR